MVCDVKRGSLYRKKGDGNGRSRGKEERKAYEERMIGQCEG